MSVWAWRWVNGINKIDVEKGQTSWWRAIRKLGGLVKEKINQNAQKYSRLPVKVNRPQFSQELLSETFSNKISYFYFQYSFLFDSYPAPKPPPSRIFKRNGLFKKCFNPSWLTILFILACHERAKKSSLTAKSAFSLSYYILYIMIRTDSEIEHTFLVGLDSEISICRENCVVCLTFKIGSVFFQGAVGVCSGSDEQREKRVSNLLIAAKHAVGNLSVRRNPRKIGWGKIGDSKRNNLASVCETLRLSL